MGTDPLDRTGVAGRAQGVSKGPTSATHFVGPLPLDCGWDLGTFFQLNTVEKVRVSLPRSEFKRLRLHLAQDSLLL